MRFLPVTAVALALALVLILAAGALAVRASAQGQPLPEGGHHRHQSGGTVYFALASGIARW